VALGLVTARNGLHSMNDLAIISARRSYEFAQDDIRLTLLSSQPVVAFVKQTFHFELGIVSTPMETFGPTAHTIPPGLVFNYGIAPVPEDSGTAIRFLHVESRRIVIDVVGPSSTIDSTFARVTEILAELKSPEGHPALGEPIGTRDYSEIRVTLDIDPGRLVPSPFLASVKDSFRADLSDRTLVPTITLRMSPEGEYPGASLPPTDIYTLDIRAGTDVPDRIYYSAGPMDSETHIRFLAEIESALHE
jgi:hypothetical protein